jgi:N,N-dimethylformamidase
VEIYNTLLTMLRGYLDRLSVGAGGQARARLSAAGGAAEVGVVRLSHGDPAPDGPGSVAATCPWAVTALRPVSEQPTASGSFALLPDALRSCGDGFALLVWVLPTYLDDQAVIASWVTAAGPVQLAIDGGRFAVVSARAGPLLRSPHPVRERQWCFVAVGTGANLSIAWGVLGRTGGPYQLVGPDGRAAVPVASSPLLLGARTGRDGQPGGAFDGKMARPLLMHRAPDAIGLMDVMNFGPERGLEGREVVARWGFGTPEDLDGVVDLSGAGHHGRLVNAPSLGVLGPPDNAGTSGPPGPTGPPFETAHFHTDDLDDCGWPDTHVVDVPPAARSGLYALRVKADGDEVDLPFVVRPGREVPVLLIAPTYTWQAYANLGRDPRQYPGLSHYGLHRDGSPVYITTRLKPAPALGPRARVEVDGVDSFIGDDEAGSTADASHLLMADLYANWWLERSGVEFGVITDEDLHLGGTGPLAGCRTMVLSAHPEYWTRAMLDALGSFLDRGGNLMYLGGNGLYWVTSVHPARPHLLEVRRGGGSQTSAAPWGEGSHVFDPQPGGTWGGQGRPPDRLVGVGFAGFGWDRAVGYRRAPASYGDRFGWVFEGVEAPVVGASGLNMGGAVAFEFDRHDPPLAPAGCEVLASAQPPGGGFFRSYEDGPGRAPDPLVRCDMTIRETDSGGLVFALGSVTASGCLPELHGETTDLARVCTNVLRRTLA